MASRSISILQFWKQLNQYLWQSKVQGADHDRYVQSELKRRTSSLQNLLRALPSGANTLSDSHQAIFKVCVWLSESDEHFAQWSMAYTYALHAIQAFNVNPQPISIILMPTQTLWKYKRVQERVDLVVNFAFISAPEEIWKSLIGNSLQKSNSIKKVKEFARSPIFQQYSALYAVISSQETIGKVYNLTALFNRVNTLYFQGNVPPTPISWAKRPSYRILGRYNFNHNCITISPVLDNAAVPLSVVEFIIFHEMLHIVHGVRDVNGKSHAHTPEFRKDEQKFNGYSEIQNLLPKLRTICEPDGDKPRRSEYFDF